LLVASEVKNICTLAKSGLLIPFSSLPHVRHLIVYFLGVGIGFSLNAILPDTIGIVVRFCC